MNKPMSGSGLEQSSTPGFETLPNGDMVVSRDQLERFGGGDAIAGRRELRLMLNLEREQKLFQGPTTLSGKVIIAGPEHEQAMLDLWLLDLNANAAHIAPIDPEKVLENVRGATRHRGSIGGVVVTEKGVLAGMVILVPQQWHWSQGWFYQEIVNFVHPDHRQRQNVDALLDFIKWVGEKMTRDTGSFTPALCGVMGTWRLRAKMGLYRRRFWQVGAAFLHPAPASKGN